MKPYFNRTVLLGMGVLGAAGVVSQQALSGPAAAKPAQAKAADARLNALLTQRRDLLQDVEKQYEAQYRAGQATTEQVERAAIAVIQADLELAHTRKERIALRQKWLDKAADIEKLAETQHRAGLITPMAYNEARLARLEAEIALEREKSGR